MSNTVYANQADALEMSRLRLSGRCTRCTEYLDHCECPPLPRTRATNHNPFEPADVDDVPRLDDPDGDDLR